jgi:hypothetical protein
MASRLTRRWVVWITLLLTAAYVVWRLAAVGWDPIGLVELGTRFSEGDPSGTEGYDGQFTYYMAVDPSPASALEKLDDPPYRYQRILFPMLVRALSLGRPAVIPWMMVALNLVIHAIGTWAVARLLEHWSQPPGYALVYGLWVGLVASIGLGMGEPLAYTLVAIGWLMLTTQRPLLGAGLLGLSLFAKETTVLFWAAALLGCLLRERRRAILVMLAIGGSAFAGWQLFLLHTFGRMGFGTGGAGVTGLEWIPFMGLWRVGAVNMRALALLAMIFVPTVVIPAVLGIVVSLTALFKREWHRESWALLTNAAMIPILTSSTFREPLGLARFATGLVLSSLLFASRRKLRRPLMYALLWLALLAMLFSR